MPEELRTDRVPEAASAWPQAQTEDGGLRTGDALLMLRAARTLTLVLRNALRPARLRVELWLLLELLADGPKRPTELAAEVAGLKGSVSRWVAELHGLGLVTCQLSVEDLRQKPVSITVYGSQQLSLARDRIAHAMLELDLPVTDLERDRVADLCRRIQKSAPGRADGHRR